MISNWINERKASRVFETGQKLSLRFRAYSMIFFLFGKVKVEYILECENNCCKIIFFVSFVQAKIDEMRKNGDFRCARIKYYETLPPGPDSHRA